MTEPASSDPTDDPHPRTSRPRSASRRNLDFFRGFLRNPGQVGSVIPSSRFMERRIVEFGQVERARVVVELGPGTGGTTRALMRAMMPDARLVTIDLDPEFSGLVRRFGDARVIAHTGSAEELPDVLQSNGFAAADTVVSGIPFSTMPSTLGESILRAVKASLSERGVFVAYQFRSAVARMAEPVFGSPQRTGIVMLNIPPMKIWQWSRPDSDR